MVINLLEVVTVVIITTFL